jgi:dipeptidase
MALGMVNYNAYAPIIKETYAALEKENDQRQKEMEDEYVALVKAGRPMAAHDLLQAFSDRTLSHALAVAHDLENRLFTRLTADIQKEYMFHGA